MTANDTTTNVTADVVVIGMGPGLDEVSYWTNREAIETKELPESLIVLGGGAIGVELAQAFAASACTSRWWRPSTAWSPWRNQRPVKCSPRCSPARASVCASVRRSPRWQPMATA